MYKQNLKLYFIINRDKCAEQIKIHMLKLQILLRNPNAPYVVICFVLRSKDYLNITLNMYVMRRVCRSEDN